VVLDEFLDVFNGHPTAPAKKGKEEAALGFARRVPISNSLI
jgi:hypothetical protein